MQWPTNPWAYCSSSTCSCHTVLEYSHQLLPYLLTPRVKHSKNKTQFLYSLCSKLFTDTTSSKRPAAAAAAAKSLQLCPTLCDPIDGSPPGSSVPGILQARTLEWVAISFSNACMHAKSLQSCPTLCDPMDSSPPGSSVRRILQARTLEWGAMSFSKKACYHHPK